MRRLWRSSYQDLRVNLQNFNCRYYTGKTKSFQQLTQREILKTSKYWGIRNWRWRFRTLHETTRVFLGCSFEAPEWYSDGFARKMAIKWLRWQRQISLLIMPGMPSFVGSLNELDDKISFVCWMASTEQVVGCQGQLCLLDFQDIFARKMANTVSLKVRQKDSFIRWTVASNARLWCFPLLRRYCHVTLLSAMAWTGHLRSAASTLKWLSWRTRATTNFELFPAP